MAKVIIAAGVIRAGKHVPAKPLPLETSWQAHYALAGMDIRRLLENPLDSHKRKGAK